MNRLFNMDNKFFTTMSRIADLIMLNILCLICCIPIFTIGASFTALYTVTLKAVKNEESYIVKSFFKAFKENFKQATIVWIIFGIIGIVLFTDYSLVPRFTKGNLTFALQVVFLAFGFVWSMMISYLFPLIAKFYNTTKNCIKNSLLMAISNLPFTILILLINLIPVIGFFTSAYFLVYGTLFYILIGFGLSAYLNSFMLNKVFKKYIPEENENDNIEEQK